MAQYTNWPAPEQLTLLLLSAGRSQHCCYCCCCFRVFEVARNHFRSKSNSSNNNNTVRRYTEIYYTYIYCIYTLCIVSVFGAYKYRSNLSLGRKRWAVLPALLCRRLWRPAGNCPGTSPTAAWACLCWISFLANVKLF